MKRQNTSEDQESPRKRVKYDTESPNESPSEDSELEEILNIESLLTIPEKEWLRKSSSGSIESAAFWDNYTLLKSNSRRYTWIDFTEQPILPNELLLMLFGCLDLRSLLDFGTTCKFMAVLLPDFDQIWQQLFINKRWRLPHEIRNKNYRMGGKQIPPIEIDNKEIDWFEEFKRNYIIIKAIKPLLLSIDEKLAKAAYASSSEESGSGSGEEEDEDEEVPEDSEPEPSESEESSDYEIYLEHFRPRLDPDAWEQKNDYYLSNDLKTYFKIYEKLAAAPLALPHLQKTSKVSNMCLTDIADIYTATDINDKGDERCLDLISNEPSLRTEPYVPYKEYADIPDPEGEYQPQEGDDESSDSCSEEASDQISGLLYMTPLEYEPVVKMFWDPMTNCIFMRDAEDYSIRCELTLVELLQSLDDALTQPVPRNPPWTHWRAPEKSKQRRPKDSDAWDTLIYDTLDEVTNYGIDRRATLLLKSAAQEFIVDAIERAEGLSVTDLEDEKYEFYTSESNNAALCIAKALSREKKVISEDEEDTKMDVQ